MTAKPTCRTLLAALLLPLAGCAKPTPPLTPSAVTVTYAGSDYSFTGPDTVAAGLVTIRLVNAGKEPHQLGLARLDSGKGMVDVAIAMRGRAVPGWMTFVGGPNTVLPGDTSTAIQALSAGDYLLICFLPAPDGKMHLEKGMERMIVVKGTAPAAADPAADNTITLNDYDVTPAHPLTAGAHTFRVENTGPQVHEVMILRMLPGKSLKDFQRWAGNDMMGPPPARPVGGIVALTKGRHAEFTVTLVAGTYVFVCFVPDDSDGKPHVAHGMVKAVTVS
jgi:uncharacterized cupredoxin-like copper-binding protein